MKLLKQNSAFLKRLLGLALAGLALASSATGQTFSLIDDFESYTVGSYNGGSTAFVANGGPWQSNVGGGTGLVSIENDGDNYLAFGWNAGARGANRTVSTIADTAVGTYYFQIRTEDGSPDTSFGLSDVATGALSDFGNFEVQVALVNNGGPTLGARNGGTFVQLVTGLAANTWYDIWVVVDNVNDTYDVFYGTSGNPDLVGTQIADDFSFRNGAASNDLVTFMTLANNHEDNNANLDNIYYTPGAVSSADVDGDNLPDVWELTYSTTLSDFNGLLLAGSGPGAGTGDFDGDNLSDFDEFDNDADPTNIDTDGDGLNDGPEVNATLNDNVTPTGFAATEPDDADSDDDTVDDLTEVDSGIVAATDPNNPDTDGDVMTDGYEYLCQTAPNALDPTFADSSIDSDGDTLFNIDEFQGFFSGVQTRADLADTDADGYGDEVEDNIGSWFDEFGTGSNPVVADTDGDGLVDGDENPDTGSVPPAGPPYNSDPNLVDTDGDSYLDSYEVAQSTNPGNGGIDPGRPASGFNLIEDFEAGSGFSIGQTISGVNGWSTFANTQAGVIADEPISGGDQVASLTDLGGFPSIYKSLADLGLQIKDGGIGTLFFQVYTAAGDHDQSFGLSDQLTPGFFDAYEAQFATVAGIRVRDGGAFADPADYPRQEWMNVWIVANNSSLATTADTYRVWVETPVGGSGQTELTGGPYTFRNTTEDPLYTVLLLVAEGGPDNNVVMVDNIYVDPDAQNLTTPAAAKPVAGGATIVLENAVFVAPNSVIADVVASPSGNFDIYRSSSPGGPWGASIGTVADGLGVTIDSAATPGEAYYIAVPQGNPAP